MPWFQKICRTVGLTLHGVVNPEGSASKKTVNKTIEEEKLSDTVTLRRTTIEEVEINPGQQPKGKD